MRLTSITDSYTGPRNKNDAADVILFNLPTQLLKASLS